ncbi:MAG: GTP cyclohydrolase I FolE [Clostridiales bacterium]|jgi:GTP cyclohydrolase I|nr:GTP cyclohydrolase I FolE [Clostridiales bacterium]
MNDTSINCSQFISGQVIVRNEYINKLINMFGSHNIQKINSILNSIADLLELCGEDVSRDGLTETPFRFMKAFYEYSSGYREDPKRHLDKVFNIDSCSDIVLVRDINFDSTCEHHLVRFYGVAHIAYIPSNKIVGLSKFARLVDGYAKRFQTQERLTGQIAKAIEEKINPKALAVIIEAKHSCICGRGAKKSNSKTSTIIMRGEFESNENVRSKLMFLLK